MKRSYLCYRRAGGGEVQEQRLAEPTGGHLRPSPATVYTRAGMAVRAFVSCCNRQGGSTRSHWTGPSLDSSEAPATLPLLAVPVPRCAQCISPLWVEGAAAPGGRAHFVPGLVAVEVELPHGRCTLVVWSPRIPVRSPIGGFRPRAWRHSLL